MLRRNNAGREGAARSTRGRVRSPRRSGFGWVCEASATLQGVERKNMEWRLSAEQPLQGGGIVLGRGRNNPAVMPCINIVSELVRNRVEPGRLFLTSS